MKRLAILLVLLISGCGTLSTIRGPWTMKKLMTSTASDLVQARDIARVSGDQVGERCFATVLDRKARLDALLPIKGPIATYELLRVGVPEDVRAACAPMLLGIGRGRLLF